MKVRGMLEKDEDGKYILKMQLSPHLEDIEDVEVDSFLEDFEGQNIELALHSDAMATTMERGLVRIKPIQIGTHHYVDVYGSVCSADVKGTPEFEKPTLISQDFAIGGQAARLARYDYIHVDPPLTVYHQKDMRRVAREITLDVDAILMGRAGCSPLEKYYLESLNLPILNGSEPEEKLLGLRAKKYVKESKFIYIGEIPSFSAPEGPWDFFKVQDRFGTRFRHIETNEFYRNFDRFSDDEVEQALKSWNEDFKIVEPPHQEMLDATRVYLALKYIAEREDANGITVNCGRFTEERPVVPCLAFARLIDEGIICSCEGDITAMLSSFMLHGISGQPILMGNFGSRPGHFEASEGEVTIEHDVVPLSMGKEKFTVRDYHGREFGVTGYVDIKEQPMTLLNLNSALDTISVIEGKIKHSRDGIHCRIIVHMDVEGNADKVRDIIVGSQHMSMTFGHWRKALEEMAGLMNLSVQTLD